MINSLSNAKRCFHYHTERLLHRYCLYNICERYSFPDKLKLLQELGIISGVLLKKYNNERNAMEHEYTKPTKVTVEKSLDLCELYLLATERFLKNTPSKLRVVFKDDNRDIILSLAPGNDKIEKYLVRGSLGEKTENGLIYKSNIYKLCSQELEDGIELEHLVEEEIIICKNNKKEWLPILRLFTSVAKGENKKVYPKEAMVTIQHSIPYRLLRQVFEQGDNNNEIIRSLGSNAWVYD